jgi:bacillithiol system protein YtxJ
MGQEGETRFPWVAITTHEDLDLIDWMRSEKPQVVFKHSTSCGLSGMMLRRFEKQWEGMGDQVDFHLLDLIGHRSLSNELAARYEVSHQSPQILILDKSGVLIHASHSHIGSLAPAEILKNPA